MLFFKLTSLHYFHVLPVSVRFQGCHCGSCETQWVSVVLSRLPQLSVSVWVRTDISPTHDSALRIYLCNSPGFGVRDHKTSQGGKFIPQKLIFITTVACLGESWCWLSDACVQCWGPCCSFYDTKWAMLSGNGVCRAWKHQKLNIYGWQSVQGETVVDEKSVISLKCVSGGSEIMTCFLQKIFVLFDQ